MLAYGNYINASNEQRGGAYGVKIDCIEKAFDFRKNDNSSNLLSDCILNIY